MNAEEKPALIDRLNKLAASLKWHNVALAQDVLAAVDALNAPPVKLPDNDLLRVLDFAKFIIKCVRKNGEYAPLSSQEPDEIDAILRKIEEAK